MTRNRAKRIALKIVKSCGNYLLKFGDVNPSIIFSPYIPLYTTPDILCSRAQAEQIERRLLRYAETDVNLAYYGQLRL